MKKSKLLEKVKYTPSFDSISVGFGSNFSVVLGKIMLYQGGKDNVCRVSQDRLSFELGLSVTSIKNIIDECRKQNFILDHTPGLVNHPHIYTILENEIIQFDKMYEEAMIIFEIIEQDLISKMDEESLSKYITTSNKIKRFRRQYIRFTYKNNKWYLKTSYNEEIIQLTKEEEIIPF